MKAALFRLEGFQQARQTLKALVTNNMTKQVVHAFEIVDIQDQKRVTARGMALLINTGAKIVIERAAIQQAG